MLRIPHTRFVLPSLVAGSLLFSPLPVMAEEAGKSASAIESAKAAEDVRKDAEGKDAAWRLKELNNQDAWEITGGNAQTAFLGWAGWVGVRLVLTEGNTTRVMLREAVKLPEGLTGLTFQLGTEGGQQQGFLARVLMRDARGITYAYKVVSPYIRGNENVIYTQHPETYMPMNLTLPGLSRPVVGDNVRNDTIAHVASPQGVKAEPRAPQQPLELLGVEFITAVPGTSRIYFGNFTPHRVTPANTALHYLIGGEELYGEVNGLPSFTVGRLGPHHGEEYDIYWTVRDRYDGQPFLAGRKTYKFDSKSEAFPLNMAERIDLPLEERGTYWVQVRRLWKNSAKAAVPERIQEWDYRIDVLKGKEPTDRKPTAEVAQEQPIRIAPGRESLIFGPKEGRDIPVEYAVPSAEGYSYRVQAVSPSTGGVRKTLEGALSQEGRQTVDIPLGDLPAGAYEIRAALLKGGAVMDETSRLAGFPGGSKDGVTKADPGADWKKFTKDRALIYVGMSKGELKNSAERVAKVKQLVDEASTVSNVIEYETTWHDLEPLPGVYDWAELDEIVAYAGEKGQTVLLWPSFVGYEPDWIPPHFQRKQDGTVTGTKSYLFQGGRMNFWHSPELKKRILDLTKAMAMRYRGNPHVHGYYLIVEHGGDNPWYGFFPGYEVETLTDFRQYLRENFKTLDALNQRWGTDYKSWDEISVPDREKATERHRLDWMVFRNERMSDFFIQNVEGIREADPYKLMMIYTGAVDGAAAENFTKLGCILADGGAAVPEQGGTKTMAYAEAGLGRRTEEISVGNWAAAFPTQLDATLFNLTLGGGRNANAKMFFKPGKPFAELRKPPMALDRYEKFIPIWQALAPTETMPRQSHLLLDRNAAMLDSGSTLVRTDVWVDMATFDAHLPSPAVPMDRAKKGKLIILPGQASFETKLADELVEYVQSGGALMLNADTGRKSVDAPQEDWVLLRKLGIAPPKDVRAGTLEAEPVKGAGLAAEAKAFKLRDIYIAPEQEGVVLATFPATKTAALTQHKVGKGQVFVAWANATPPATEGGGYPFLRDIGRMAGVEVYSDATEPGLWTNLLRNPKSGQYFGTVYHAAWSRRDRPAIAGNTLWSVPDGTYEITELISGEKLGAKSGAELGSTGLPTKLGPREVAVYQFDPK